MVASQKNTNSRQTKETGGQLIRLFLDWFRLSIYYSVNAYKQPFISPDPAKNDVLNQCFFLFPSL